MATKSILKDVTIRDRTASSSFITALEHAQNKKTADINMSRQHKTISKDEISKIFGGKK